MPRKSTNHQFDLPPLELECMRALWSLGHATVRQVRAAIEPRRALAYTTVMTVMDRLARKGVVGREQQGRSHLYWPVISQAAIRSRAIQKLIDALFEGSPEMLLEYLAVSSDGASSGDRLSPVAALESHLSLAKSVASANEGIDPSLL